MLSAKKHNFFLGIFQQTVFNYKWSSLPFRKVRFSKGRLPKNKYCLSFTDLGKFPCEWLNKELSFKH